VKDLWQNDPLPTYRVVSQFDGYARKDSNLGHCLVRVCGREEAERPLKTFRVEVR